MLQPDSIIRCKQGQHNNCRLAHTAEYYPYLFFAMHMGIMLQLDSIIRCKQGQHNNCRLAHTAEYYPFLFFAMHTGIMLQPDSIIRCKQGQHNNCRLAHTAEYYPFLFFAMHMGIMLQPEGTIRCKQARQFVPAAIYQTMKFFCNRTRDLYLQPEPTFANFHNHQNFRNILHKNTDNETANHPGSMGFATRSCKPTAN
jgi:hypothetical protein